MPRQPLLVSVVRSNPREVHAKWQPGDGTRYEAHVLVLDRYTDSGARAMVLAGTPSRPEAFAVEYDDTAYDIRHTLAERKANPITIDRIVQMVCFFLDIECEPTPDHYNITPFPDAVAYRPDQIDEDEGEE